MKGKSIAIALIVFAVTSTAWAAGETTDRAPEAVKACWNKKTGALKLRSVGGLPKTCARSEKTIDWAKAGPEGPRGERGRRGARGPRGAPGTSGDSSPAITEHIVATCTSLVESPSTVCSTASWTQPANTIGTLFYRANIVTPGGTCQSAEAAILGGWKFWFNGIQVSSGSGGIFTLGPGERRVVPGDLGSLELPGALFPGQYELETGGFSTVTIAPDCTDTILETELFVETVAGA